MRRKQKALVDVIAERLSSHQEAVLDNIKWYPDEPYRSRNLKQSLKNHTRRTVEAILEHLRTVEAEERSALERELFDEEKTKGSARNDSQICSDRLDAQSAKESAPEQDSR